ncbi:MAG TPA: pyruvate synthase subunit PorB [Dehalococcoidales bacterium]|jgi:pyruvate ferredoxin oxidoreductase beta subunit|nr:pyruvate synthase subunit PorB [Dehalococcoidales bacterium]
MDNIGVYAARVAPKFDGLAPGHRACIGCGEALAVRIAMKAMGPNIIIANATGCMEVISSQLPATGWDVPWIHTLFENNSAVASGIESALKVLERKGKIQGRGTKVVAMGGDGATSDIGFQALSGALERGHDFLYLMFDNEAYMNTGIQRSSATPWGASTTTSPAGKKSIGQKTQKKNMAAIVAAHEIPYVATACPSYPFDMMEKVKKGLAVNGPAFINVFSVCPTGWRSAVDLSVRLGRLAVQTGVFPLYEVVNGKYKITVEPSPMRPVQDYLKPQGRFRHLSENDVKEIQERTIREYNMLKARTTC